MQKVHKVYEFKCYSIVRTLE